MSDILHDYRKKNIDWKLKVSSEAPLSYINRQLDLQSEVVFCVDIPWPLLQLWRNLLEGTSDENANYIDLLNLTVVDGWFVIKRECERIDALLSKKSCDVKMAYKQTKGRKRKELDDKLYRLSVRRGEIDSNEVNKAEIKQCRDEAEMYKQKYSDLEKEKNDLYEEMIKEVNRLEEEITDLKQVNKELADYVDTLEKKEFLNCNSKKINEVGNKQKGRKLRLLKNRAQCALWFCRSFGLELTHIKVRDEDGCSYPLYFNNHDNATPPTDYPEDDKNNLEKILFLLDKFCVGDEVYHEFTTLSEDLPKSYLIKQLRSDLNKTYHIERTMGKCPGAKLDFSSTLSAHIEDLLLQKPELRNQVVQVKLSGDGARMSRSTNFMMMSFALLQCKEKVMSSKSNRTVAIINGPEKYETLRESLSSLFKEINELIRTGTILINDDQIKLEFFLGGDMKFLLMLLGLAAATSDYACLWCKIHKDDRWDTSKDMNFYSRGSKQRTLEDIKACLQSKSFSCINEPLIDIPLDHVVPDELHLFLRVTDRLLENVINEVEERDAIADFNKKNGQSKGVLLAKLVQGINDCGVPFHIWSKKNADGSASKILEFTSLVGSQKKKLLNKLPPKLKEYLYPETCNTVCKIWRTFEEYYNLISDFSLTSDAANDIFNKGKEWIELFCSLKNIRPGYTQARVTPYMHLMPYHVPFFIQKYGCIKKFTGQGVEKNNDDAKKIMFHKSNKWDSAADILRTESRLWDLKERERQKNTYTKRKLEYWEEEIISTRRKRRALSQISNLTTDGEDDSSGGPRTDLSPTDAMAPDYERYTVRELIAIVKGKHVQKKGLSKLRKNQLIALLEQS